MVPRIAAVPPLPPSSQPNALPLKSDPPHSRVALINAAQNKNMVVNPQKAYSAVMILEEGSQAIINPPNDVNYRAIGIRLRAENRSANVPPNI